MKSPHDILYLSLRHRVEIEEKTQTPDGAGGFETAWTSALTVWCSIEKLSGGEKYTGGKTTARSTHRFRLRYRTGIDTEMRLNYEGRLFNIRSITNEGEQNRVLEILAEEGA